MNNKYIAVIASFFASALFFGATYASQVGTTTGIFELTPGGQSSYSVGIEMPPGIQGVVPQVAITYNSTGGNGLLGIGANLSGLSSISRCGSTIEQDGAFKPVQYDQNDHFCMNGQRLVLISGQYGAAGSVYHTEIESFQRVTANGALGHIDAGVSPVSFTVESRGGSEVVYGANAAARLTDPISSAVTSWSISYLQDRNGNRIDYEYADYPTTVDGVSTKQSLPKAIHYGRNDSANVTGNLKVEFVYENRPDISRGYSRGQKHVATKRISNITTSVADDIVKDYRIAYELSPVSQQSRITTVTECAGNEDCLTPVTFSWHDYDEQWSQGDDLPEAILTTQGKLRGTYADVNNDGHVDWVTAYRNESGQELLSTYLNNAGQWSISNAYTPPSALYDYNLSADGLGISELVDINGDNLPDWVAAYQSSAGIVNRIWINTGSGWQLDITKTLPSLLSDISNADNPVMLSQLLDINGDQLPDLIASTSRADGSSVKQTWINKLNGWQLSTEYAPPIILTDYTAYTKGAVKGQTIDINGDGLVDIVSAYKSDNGNTVKQTWLNTGAGWQANTTFNLPVITTDYSKVTPESLANTIDINGDGLLDIIQAHILEGGTRLQRTWLNTGNGWLQNEELQAPAILWEKVGSINKTKGVIADLNNDGLPDFSLSYKTDTGQFVNRVWKNKGDGWIEQNDLIFPTAFIQDNSSEDSYARGILFDVNSDGQGDLIYSQGGSTSKVYLRGVGQRGYALPEAAWSFTDGLGASYVVEYKPTTYGDLYTPSTGSAYPNIDVSSPMVLVSAVESSDASGSLGRSDYQYFGKKVNLTGRGDLGFAKKVATDNRTLINLETQFSQQWPTIGSAISLRKVMPNGTVLFASDNRFAYKDLYAGKTIFPYQDQKQSQQYELDGAEISSGSQTTSFDNFGNPISTVNASTDLNGTTTRTTETTYQNDESSWLLGLVQSVMSTSNVPGSSPHIMTTGYSYYADGSLKNKTVGQGNAQAVTEAYEYDNFGHIVKTTISASDVADRFSSTIYTSDGRFVASTSNQLGHTGYVEYHPHFGQVTRTLSVNGNETIKLYDDHGRMIKTTNLRSEADSESAVDDAKNVIVFKSCLGEATCPTNAAFLLAVIDNEGESPETVYYDNRNREVRKQTQGFDGTSVYVDTIYDSFGRKWKASKPYFKDDTPKWTTIEYDVLGRKSKIISSEGYETSYSYFADRTVVTNPVGQKSITWKNGAGKPLKVVDEANKEIRYQYDAAGNLLKTIDDQGNEITLKYDYFGRKINQSDPDLGDWEYKYNSLGELIWQKDAKGQIVTMEYDLLGRIVKRTEPEGITQWTYDTALNGLGKLAQVWDGQGYVRSHKYDKHGRSTDVTTTIDGESNTITTAFIGTTDRVDYVKYSSGLTVRKTYNDYGFPLEIRSNGLAEYQRYLDQIDKTQALAATAQQLIDDTEGERATLYTAYTASDGEITRLNGLIEGYQADYQSRLGGYRSGIRKQSELISKARKYAKKGDTWRKTSEKWNKKAEEYAKKAKDLVDNPEYITIVVPASENRQGIVPSYTKKVPKYSKKKRYAMANSLAWDAQDAANRANYSAGEANSAYKKAQSYNKSAQARAKSTKKYYDTKLKPLIELVEDASEEAGGHVTTANEKAKAIAAIDQRVKKAVDLAQNASEQADIILEYYTDHKSVLHWRAEEADAEGKVLKFMQGKHVTTDVSYSDYSGRLSSVYTHSAVDPVETQTSDTFPSVLARVNGFIGQLNNDKTSSASHFAQAQEDQAAVQEVLDTLDPNDPGLSPALKLATQAQIQALTINFNVHNVDAQVNQQIYTVATSTLASTQQLLDTFSQVEANTSNVLVLSSKLHSLMARYNRSVRDSYQAASQVQTNLIADMQDVSQVSPEYLQEYKDLGAYHQSLADQHGAHADSIVVDPSETANTDPFAYGYAYASQRHRRLFGRHADVSQKLRRLNKALYTPLQLLNVAAAEKHTLAEQGTLASHFEGHSEAGLGEKTRLRELEKVYRARVLEIADLDQNASDGLTNNADRKQIYEYLSQINSEMSEMYTDMGDQSYWDDMYLSFTSTLTDKSSIYNQLSINHDKIANNNELLANESSSEFDHALLGNDGVVLNDSYTWDSIGNLVERNHSTSGVLETFEYDELNRLTRSSMSGTGVALYELAGLETTTYEYDALGNITYKSDVGHYTYGGHQSNGHASPHAVTRIDQVGQASINYQYDHNGNMTSGDGRAIQYASYNKPIAITKGDSVTGYFYGPERQLIKDTQVIPNGLRTTVYFSDGYEKTSDTYGTTSKYHISINGGTIAVITDKQDADIKTNYLHRDHLNSIVAITDEKGFIIERFHYDAFGKQLTSVGISTSDLSSDLANNTLDLNLTDRGYTGHKMLADSELIHMRGRVYDPKIGRFLSADPHIQFAGNLQSYNRYSYVLNNPLAYNDPSGYFLSSLFKSLKKLFKKLVAVIKKVINVVKKVVKFIKENIKVIAVVVVAVVAPYAASAIMSYAGGATVAASIAGATATGLGLGGAALAGAIAGGMSGLIMTGSLKGMLKGALIGGLSAGIAHKIGTAFINSKFSVAGKLSTAGKVLKTVAHSTASGVINKLQGGSFGKGFASAFISTGAYASGLLGNSAFAAGVVGGISSKVAGGNFAQRFAQSYAIVKYNDHALHPAERKELIKNEYGERCSSGCTVVSDGGVYVETAGTALTHDAITYGHNSYPTDEYGNKIPIYKNSPGYNIASHMSLYPGDKSTTYFEGIPRGHSQTIHEVWIPPQGAKNDNTGGMDLTVFGETYR